MSRRRDAQRFLDQLRAQTHAATGVARRVEVDRAFFQDRVDMVVGGRVSLVQAFLDLPDTSVPDGDVSVDADFADVNDLASEMLTRVQDHIEQTAISRAI